MYKCILYNVKLIFLLLSLLHWKYHEIEELNCTVYYFLFNIIVFYNAQILYLIYKYIIFFNEKKLTSDNINVRRRIITISISKNQPIYRYNAKSNFWISDKLFKNSTRSPNTFSIGTYEKFTKNKISLNLVAISFSKITRNKYRFLELFALQFYAQMIYTEL